MLTLDERALATAKSTAKQVYYEECARFLYYELAGADDVKKYLNVNGYKLDRYDTEAMPVVFFITENDDIAVKIKASGDSVFCEIAYDFDKDGYHAQKYRATNKKLVRDLFKLVDKKD